jgi:hypothetical protein
MNEKQHATAQDFELWTRKAKQMEVSSLRYVIKDCHNAARAMATHPQPNREGYYIDQALTYEAELNRRNRRE